MQRGRTKSVAFICTFISDGMRKEEVC